MRLYDVTTLYFEAEKEDDLRRVGYSKERRVDPQIVVGLLVDRGGFPLEIGCFAGNQAETATIIPIITAFQARHRVADMVVVADAGMLSAGNLRKLDEAGLRFIVGSRVTKAPIDLASHFHWHGDAFTDGQVIDTITPKTGHHNENNKAVRAEPAWNPHTHTGSWRAVWAYSHKRAVRDRRTLAAQEERARAVVNGQKTARTPRFVKTSNGAQTLDQASLDRARRLVGLQSSRSAEGPRVRFTKSSGNVEMPTIGSSVTSMPKASCTQHGAMSPLAASFTSSRRSRRRSCRILPNKRGIRPTLKRSWTAFTVRPSSGLTI